MRFLWKRSLRTLAPMPKPLDYLARSIEFLAKADVAVSPRAGEYARGCRERQCAEHRYSGNGGVRPMETILAAVITGGVTLDRCADRQQQDAGRDRDQAGGADPGGAVAQQLRPAGAGDRGAAEVANAALPIWKNMNTKERN